MFEDECEWAGVLCVGEGVIDLSTAPADFVSEETAIAFILCCGSTVSGLPGTTVCNKLGS